MQSGGRGAWAARGGEEVLGEGNGHRLAGGVGRGIQIGDELLLGQSGEALVLAGSGLGSLGLGLKAVGAAAGEHQDLGSVVTVAEAGELGEDFAEALPAVLGVGGMVKEAAGGEGKAGGSQGGEIFGERGAGGVGADGVGILGDFGYGKAGLLEGLPISKAALFPMG